MGNDKKENECLAERQSSEWLNEKAGRPNDELKEKMIDRAIEKGVLDIAKSNAETVISGMLESSAGDYDIKIEWQ